MFAYCPKCHENVEIDWEMVSPAGEGGPAEYEPCCSICGNMDIGELLEERELEED